MVAIEKIIQSVSSSSFYSSPFTYPVVLYLLIVSVECYFCTWSHSITHTRQNFPGRGIGRSQRPVCLRCCYFWRCRDTVCFEFWCNSVKCIFISVKTCDRYNKELVCKIYRVIIKSFLDYKHVLQENHVLLCFEFWCNSVKCIFISVKTCDR